MREYNFTKMHGLGNDFIVFDEAISLDETTVNKLANRRTGIGADGVIIVDKNQDG